MDKMHSINHCPFVIYCFEDNGFYVCIPKVLLELN